MSEIIMQVLASMATNDRFTKILGEVMDEKGIKDGYDVYSLEEADLYELVLETIRRYRKEVK